MLYPIKNDQIKPDGGLAGASGYTRFFLACVVFVLVCAISAFCFWSAGFNFDARNFDVGFGVALTVFVAAAGSLIVVGITSK